RYGRYRPVPDRVLESGRGCPKLDSQEVQGLEPQASGSCQHRRCAGDRIPVFTDLQEPEALGRREQRPLRRQALGRWAGDEFRILRWKGLRAENVSLLEGQLPIAGFDGSDGWRRAGPASDHMAWWIRRYDHPQPDGGA